MLDTVTIFYPHKLHANLIPVQYRLTHYTVPPPVPAVNLLQNKSYSYDDPETGFHAYGKEGHLQYFRASLPRLLHGHNGKLIKDQTEVDAALTILFDQAGKLGSPLTGDYHFTRVDLVQQFRADTSLFVLAHRQARHPRLRCDPVFYGGRSLVLDGAEMRISFYDKQLKALGRRGDVLRIEIQLRGKRLKEDLGNGDRVKTLNFDSCYQSYRRTMLGFVPNNVPKSGNIAHFLAIAEHEGWESDGISAFEIYTSAMSDRHLRRLKIEMAACRPGVHRIDWSQILPAAAPPLPVELDSKDY